MIYTAIIGGRDAPRDDIKCFTEYDQFIEPVLNAKIYKILSHLWVPGQSIWVDGNIFAQEKEDRIFLDIPYHCDLALFKHPHRSNAREEARTLVEMKFRCRKWIEDWRANRPQSFAQGLIEANVIIRRDNERVRRFNEIWWSLVCRFPWRDQITLPEAIRESGCRVHLLHWDGTHQHKFFNYQSHKPSPDHKSQKDG